MTSDDKLLTPKQAAEYLGVKENTLAVWRSTKRYDLPYIKIGKSIRYKLSEIETYINRKNKS